MTAIRDMYSNVKVTKCLVSATRTADANGSSVDTRDYDSLVFVANVGASGDTLSGSVKAELELEESDDDSTFTDVADADMHKVVTGTNTGCWALIDASGEDSSVYMTGYRGKKRYVRPVYNITGTHTNGMPVGIVAIQGHAHQKPVQ